VLAVVRFDWPTGVLALFAFSLLAKLASISKRASPSIHQASSDTPENCDRVVTHFNLTLLRPQSSVGSVPWHFEEPPDAHPADQTLPPPICEDIQLLKRGCNAVTSTAQLPSAKGLICSAIAKSNTLNHFHALMDAVGW
jgi:hypothetical protein